MEIFISHSPRETKEYAASLAQRLPRGSVIAYYGGLGVGKTAFTDGFVAGLGIEEYVSSPTFALINSYVGKENTVHHFDMYRVESWDSLYSTGFFDYLDTQDYLCVEWSENIDGAIPDTAVCVEIERIDDNTRKITVYEKGNRK